MGRSAFIVGGTGQIGRAATSRLADRGWEVTVAARHPEPVEGATRVVALDRERELDAEADVVVDCVAFTTAHARQLLALEGRIGSIVVVSTGSVYADGTGRTIDEARDHGFPEYPVPIGEAQPTVEPGDKTYSTRKRALELALLDQEKLPATLLRPCAVHGPHSKSHVREWFFAKRILDDRRAVALAHRGASRFHTSSVANIAELVLLAAERPGTRVLNAADPGAPNVLEIGRAIQDALAVELMEVLVPGMHEAARNPWATPNPTILDMAAAERELGYRPVTTYEEAVGDTVRWLIDERPPLDRYMATFFDYEAEDALLRTLLRTSRTRRREGG